MGRRPCCSKEGLNRGAWTAVEDQTLTDYIKVHGEGRWRYLPKRAGLKRCGKSCRLRWLNYLRPDIKRGNISHDEEELIIRLHKLLGNRWSLIAGRLPGRTDNEIKNYWNTNLGKKVRHHNSVSTHNRYSNEKDKKRTTGIASPVKSRPRNESCVVRTKPISCSKVFISPQPQKTEPIDTNTVVVQPLLVEEEEISIIKPIMGSNSCAGASSMFTPEEDDPSDFMLDFNIGEVCLSDILNSDFSELACDINYSNNEFYPSSDEPLLFSKELMVEDWIINQHVEPNVLTANYNPYSTYNCHSSTYTS